MTRKQDDDEAGHWLEFASAGAAVRVQVGETWLSLSQPLRKRPSVILIETDDGRRQMIGDGDEPVVELCEAKRRERRKD